MGNPFIRVLAMPGLWLQKLTTGLPSRDQIEVAIRALTEVLETESRNSGAKGSDNDGLIG